MEVINHNPDFYHLTFGRHPVQMSLKSGQAVITTLPDCDGVGTDGKVLDDDKFERGRDGDPLPKANPMVGPYYIEDAEVGDCIAVRIEDIKIDRNFGRTGISPQQTQIPAQMFSSNDPKEKELQLPTHIYKWNLDLAGKTAYIEGHKNISIPLRPCVGLIAVAPKDNMFLDGLAIGSFGGNMDIPYTTVNSVVYMPVFAKGAYLFVGDLHASQGDGEVIGGAIEVGGQLRFSIEVKKGEKIRCPMIETSDKIGFVGIGSNAQQAIQAGYAELTLWLSQKCKIDIWKSLNLISQVGYASPGNFQTAFCSINKILLSALIRI